MKKLDKFGLCLEEYTNNKNNAQIYHIMYNKCIDICFFDFMGE